MGVLALKRNQKGYTLVETMAAIAIGLIGITAIGSTLDAGIFTTVDNRSRLYATNALREEMETLRRTPYDTIAGYGSTSTFANTQTAHLVAGAGTRSIAVLGGNDISRVTLTVSWTGRRGNALSQSITTYVSRRGLNGT